MCYAKFRTLNMLVLAGVLSAAPVLADDAIQAQARELSQRLLIADTHIDVPYRLEEAWEDVTRATASGDFDYPRAVAGGLNLPFMSIYTPASMEAIGGGYQLANRLIDSVEALVGRAPDRFAVVATPAEALAAIGSGRLALALGMENGTPIEGKLENIAFFRDRNISYITLAHSLSNHISDSSYDPNRAHGGLSEFGRAVVREMNRLGIMVDVSHVSDAAFWQVLEISSVPVIASHSSARHYTPGFERNMSDAMIQALAEKGGIIQINFGSSFLTPEANAWGLAFMQDRAAWLTEHGFEAGGPEVKQFEKARRAANPFPYATLDQAVAHFEHVIDLVGVEHVGIGSDFDGVGDSLPMGLKDVSDYPALVAAMLERGYSEADIEKILGGNLMRVWSEVTGHAAP